MAVTEKQRHELIKKLEEAFGADHAETMMELLPPVGWADVARRSDIERLERGLAQLRADFADLRAEFGDLRAEQLSIRAEQSRIRVEFADLRAEMHEALRDQTNRMLVTVVASQSVLAGIVGLIVGVG